MFLTVFLWSWKTWKSHRIWSCILQNGKMSHDHRIRIQFYLFLQNVTITSTCSGLFSSLTRNHGPLKNWLRKWDSSHGKVKEWTIILVSPTSKNPYWTFRCWLHAGSIKLCVNMFKLNGFTIDSNSLLQMKLGLDLGNRT